MILSISKYVVIMVLLAGCSTKSYIKVVEIESTNSYSHIVTKGELSEVATSTLVTSKNIGFEWFNEVIDNLITEKLSYAKGLGLNADYPKLYTGAVITFQRTLGSTIHKYTVEVAKLTKNTLTTKYMIHGTVYSQTFNTKSNEIIILKIWSIKDSKAKILTMNHENRRKTATERDKSVDDFLEAYIKQARAEMRLENKKKKLAISDYKSKPETVRFKLCRKGATAKNYSLAMFQKAWSNNSNYCPFTSRDYPNRYN